MNPIEFEGVTGNLARPVDMAPEECGSLPVKKSTYLGKYPQYESVWELSSEEVEKILISKKIRLCVVSGVHPPVSLSVE